MTRKSKLVHKSSLGAHQHAAVPLLTLVLTPNDTTTRSPAVPPNPDLTPNDLMERARQLRDSMAQDIIELVLAVLAGDEEIGRLLDTQEAFALDVSLLIRKEISNHGLMLNGNGRLH